MQIAEKHPSSDVLYLVITDRKIKHTQYIHVNRIRKYVARESRPEDQVLDVPTYDFNYDEIPMNPELSEAIQKDSSLEKQRVTHRKNQATHKDSQESFQLVQHSKRGPTIAEASLVGKVFVDDGQRFIVRIVKYHPKEKVMVAWYERLTKQGDQWVGTGSTEYSSIPEVQYWIDQSERVLYRL